MATIDNTENQLHILVIPAWMPREADPAAGSFIIEQALALCAQKGVKVGMLYVDRFGVPSSTLELLERNSINHEIRKSHIPRATRFLIRRRSRICYNCFMDYVRRHGKPDILHAHSYVAGFAANYISQKTRIPFVLTEHSTNFLKGAIKWYHASALRDTLHGASRIIAVGDALRSELEKLSRKKVHVLPNPVNTEIFNCEHRPINEVVFTIITIGSLIPRKRMDLAIRAMALLDNTRLVIIGSGPEELPLKRHAGELRVSDRITWYRHCSPNEIALHLKQAQCLISTSVAETSGIAVTEALLCGIPVVCTASGGPEYFIHESQGAVLHNNASAVEISHAIDAIRTNYASYDHDDISRQARAIFSREVVMPKLLLHFSECLEPVNHYSRILNG